MTDKNNKWVKKGLFWVESPEEKARIRHGGKITLLAGLILGLLAVASYYILSYFNLKLVGIEILKLFGSIAAIILSIGLWTFITGNKPPAGKYS